MQRPWLNGPDLGDPGVLIGMNRCELTEVLFGRKIYTYIEY